MPCLELKVALQRSPGPASRLRALLERPGAAVLRRNHVTEVSGHDAALRGRLRVTAVLAVDLTAPPRETESPAEGHAEATASDRSGPGEEDSHSPDAGFARGLEIWVAEGARSACVHADADEIAGALVMFNSYLRLARYQPAYQCLDQRIVGLSYQFREGLAVAIQGCPGEAEPAADAPFESAAAIPEVDDFRDACLTVRLSNDGLGYFHDLLRSASAWLQDNSYPNILGSK